jgi:uncharacterized protein YegP (UPF0339 family)
MNPEPVNPDDPTFVFPPLEVPEPIIAENYQTRRLFKRQWRFRFIAANGETLGDDYNNRADSEHAIRLLTDPTVPVELRTVYLDGTTINHGRIR